MKGYALERPPANLIHIKDGADASPQIADAGRSVNGRPRGEGSMAAASRWPRIARVLRKHALMDEMMEAQGVDLLAAVRAGDAFVRARANCRDCKNDAACRAWFLERTGEPADFCPNGEFFASLKPEK
jgi:hypothetical protein